MRRRAFRATLVAVFAVAAFPDAIGQVQERIYRLAVLAPGDNTSWASSPFHMITVPELARLGFVEGRKFAIQAEIGPEPQFDELARRLVQGAPDVIVAVSGTAARGGARGDHKDPNRDVLQW